LPADPKSSRPAADIEIREVEFWEDLRSLWYVDSRHRLKGTAPPPQAAEGSRRPTYEIGHREGTRSEGEQKGANAPRDRSPLYKVMVLVRHNAPERDYKPTNLSEK